MSLLLDSSILVKLVVNEPGSGDAREAVKKHLREGYRLHTVDVALPEALNALWKHVTIHNDLGEKEAGGVIEDLQRIWVSLYVVSSHEVTRRAFQIAVESSLTVYDSLFIAAAMYCSAKLFTADVKLFKSSEKHVDSLLLK
ncbi:PIN domain-containing protein [Candidatus Bathyarchaeota archaeon]|nr:PIN domain-containing protein [Candidatus Bathyarchaeota archaeon]